jgi:adenylate kinase
MNIIFLGLPGSGKGTQADLLSKYLNIPSISTGELLRNEIKNKSDIGLHVKRKMDIGELVDDEIVINILKSNLIKEYCKKGFILDGFPRNLNQAIKLENMLDEIHKKIDKVINFIADEDIIIKRILGRYSCRNCNAIYNSFYSNTKIDGECDRCGSKEFDKRLDDNENTIRNRIEVFNQSNFKIVEFYSKKNLIVSVDALKLVPLIFEEIKSSINNNLN